MHGLDSNAVAQYSCLDLCSKSLATQLPPFKLSEAATVRIWRIITTTVYTYFYGRFNSRKVLMECSLIKKKQNYSSMRCILCAFNPRADIKQHVIRP
jgi:hypothetical protein